LFVLKARIQSWVFRWVGPIFLGLLWDIKIFIFEIQKFWQQNCREWRKNCFLFFWPLNSMIFLILYDLKKKAKEILFFWFDWLNAPFFVVIADDKFEMIVGRTFLIFFLVHFFHKFFLYESFLSGLSAKKPHFKSTTFHLSKIKNKHLGSRESLINQLILKYYHVIKEQIDWSC